MIGASAATGCLLAVAVVVSGCTSAGETAAAPMAASLGDESPWPYLQSKYDRNGDGRIDAYEYDRSGTSIDRLDRNGDGAIAEDDFALQEGGRAERRRMMIGQATVGAYFQNDDDATNLTRDELEQSIEAYDADDDGRVTQSEFDAAHDERHVATAMSEMMTQMMPDLDPWESMTDAADGDGDDVLAADELTAYFDSTDDGDGVWPIRSPRPRSAGRDRPREEEMSGPKVGTMAPDFTLSPPDGGPAVTLSSFRERNLPVALIFGSYT